MPARLLMFAHAETAATRRAAFGAGESIEPRARDAAAAFIVPRHDLALASPATAARETAAVLGLAALDSPALRDLDVGSWSGRTVTDLAAVDAAAVAAFFADPAFTGHGGESIETLIARVASFLQELRKSRDRIVAITHAAVVRAAVVTVLDAPNAAFWRIDVAPLEGLAFGSDGRRWTLRLGS